jgi:hypothetical protein
MNRTLWLCLALALPAFTQGSFTWKDKGDGKMELMEAGQPVLTYNYGPQLKPGVPEDRRRCCYVFPLYTPAGVSLLDDFPVDHHHHRGVFWSWTIIDTQGKRYDSWMAFTVKSRSAKKPAVASDSKAARLEAQNFWEADAKDIVKERLRLRVFPTQGNSRELDVELTWEALGAPVVLQGSSWPGKSYGGVCVRFAPREGTIIRADDEVLKQDEDLNPHRWAELEAVYGGKRAVLRVTSDPTNPGAPHQWCLRNYGFVEASFPGRTATVDRYALAPGKPLRLSYRIRLSDLP